MSDMYNGLYINEKHNNYEGNSYNESDYYYYHPLNVHNRKYLHSGISSSRNEYDIPKPQSNNNNTLSHNAKRPHSSHCITSTSRKPNPHIPHRKTVTTSSLKKPSSSFHKNIHIFPNTTPPNNSHASPPLSLSLLSTPIPHFDASKHSTISSSSISISYGANTHQGILRTYNEDRVSIIFNLKRPPTLPVSSPWPRVSFFAIYDGHGGPGCASFLRDNLHSFICHNSLFPSDIPGAILSGFSSAESRFLSAYPSDKSGSCALVVLIVEHSVFIANCGDSRAVLSYTSGQWRAMTVDHKPHEPTERKRIEDNGGEVYQSRVVMQGRSVLMGPYRVVPGRLSVSRTLGDKHAKMERRGVVIAEPDVVCVDAREVEFIVMGCDGVFDKMSSRDVVQAVRMVFKEECEGNREVHEKCGNAVDVVLKGAMVRRSCDNVTCIVIAVRWGSDKGKGGKVNTGIRKMLDFDNGELMEEKYGNVMKCNWNRNNVYPLSTLNKNISTINASYRTSMYGKFPFAHSVKHNSKPLTADKIYSDYSNSYNSNNDGVYNNNYNTIDSISLKKKRDLYLNADSLILYPPKHDQPIHNKYKSFNGINTSNTYSSLHNQPSNTPTYTSSQSQRYHSTIQRYNSTISHTTTHNIRLNTDRYNNYLI